MLATEPHCNKFKTDCCSHNGHEIRFKFIVHGRSPIFGNNFPSPSFKEQPGIDFTYIFKQSVHRRALHACTQHWWLLRERYKNVAQSSFPSSPAAITFCIFLPKQKHSASPAFPPAANTCNIHAATLLIFYIFLCTGYMM